MIALMEGDGADDAEDIEALLASIDAGAQDFGIDSRTRGIRRPGSMGLHQVVAGRVVGFLIGLSFETASTDMGAFRATRRGALLALDMGGTPFGLKVEMQARAAPAGLRPLEVPAPYGARTDGRSRVAGSLRRRIAARWQFLATVMRVSLQSTRDVGPHGGRLDAIERSQE